MVSVERLKNIRLFGGIPASVLTSLAANIDEKSYQKGDILAQEGEDDSAIFVVRSGRVTVRKRMAEGEKVVARIGAGEFFSDMTFVENNNYCSATLMAEEDTHALVFYRSALHQLMEIDPKAALQQMTALMAGLSSRLRDTTRELVALYEEARLVAEALSSDDLSRRITLLLARLLGESATAAFYQWNPFNEEFSLTGSAGRHATLFAPVLSPEGPEISALKEGLVFVDLARQPAPSLSFGLSNGHMAIGSVDVTGRPEGLILVHLDRTGGFRAGDRQLLESMGGVLAPAVASARMREEEAARIYYQQKKGERFPI